MILTIYGDLNCPFSALASARADALIARGGHQIDRRAIQHDTTIPAAGEPVDREAAAGLAAEIAGISPSPAGGKRSSTRCRGRSPRLWCCPTVTSRTDWAPWLVRPI